jgi:hypothetical protein
MTVIGATSIAVSRGDNLRDNNEWSILIQASANAAKKMKVIETTMNAANRYHSHENNKNCKTQKYQ